MDVNTNFAGLALHRWLFALRMWLAINVALGVAFWLQFDGASSAGVTAAILSLQTRGQVLDKSLNRVLGTVVGGVMSLVIVGLFAQTRDLYIVACSAWLGACVFVAGFLDGNRAYGAVLSGYTVSIVAISGIDDPGGAFHEVVNRCGAIAIGIISVTFFNDVLRGREIGPSLIKRIGNGYNRVQDFADTLLRSGPNSGTDPQTAHMLRVVSDQHVLLNALPVEAVSGTARAGAARATLAALVAEIRAVRALMIARNRPAYADDPRSRDLVIRRLEGEFLARRDTAADCLAASRDGRPVPNAPGMPIFRARENALRNALRAFLVSGLGGVFFILAGWPAASASYSLMGVIVCLSSNAPDPRTLARAVLTAIPIAIVAGGITLFLILGGVDQFPLLMIGTAPTLIGSLLLASSTKQPWPSVGLMTTVYTVAVIGPSNPQSYDPQSYVTTAILMLTAAILVFVLIQVLLPTNDAQRLRWALASARRDMHAALRGKGRAQPEDESRLLDASRIGSLVGLKDTRPSDFTIALRMADLARAARRIWRRLDELASPMAIPAFQAIDKEVRRAVASADADGLRRASRALVDIGDNVHLTLAADMAWAADLIDSPTEPAMPEVAR